MGIIGAGLVLGFLLYGVCGAVKDWAIAELRFRRRAYSAGIRPQVAR